MPAKFQLYCLLLRGVLLTIERRFMKPPFLLFFIFASAVFAQSKPRLVLMISIDGLKPEYVIEAEKYGLKIPHLRRLAKEGTYAERVTGVTPTVTYPSHVTLVTGAHPKTHSILSNTSFDPLLKNGEGWNWFSEDIKVKTLWDILKENNKVTSSVDWPVTVGADITYNIPQFFKASGTSDDYKVLKALSTPGLLKEMEPTLGIYPAGYQYSIEDDEKRVHFNKYLIEKKRPQFHLAYFSSLDEIQHGYGPFTKEAFQTLERLDVLVGELWNTAQRVTEQHAVVAVVSDHGFVASHSVLRLNAAFREAGLIKVDGEGGITSWLAYAYCGSASAGIYLKNPSDNDTRKRVENILKSFSNAADPLLGTLLNTSSSNDTGGFPGAAFVVGAKPGFVLPRSIEKPVVSSKKLGGDHGYLPSVPEMDSAFFIGGVGIPKGKVIKRIELIDIAPTLASLFEINLPSSEGVSILKK